MKLLYITNGINGAGGLERVLSVKASYLADHYNYSVTILSLNNQHLNPFYEFSERINMRSIDVAGHPVQYIQQYKKGIQKTVDEVNPDIILVCDDGLKAFFIPKILGNKIPVIYERHVSKEIEMKQGDPLWKRTMVKLKWQLMEKMAGSFSKFVVLTEGNRKEWQSLQNLVVIPNPLSFYPAEASTLQNKTVIAVGKHGYQKGYDRLLQAWKTVHTQYPDWKLEIYGKIAPEFRLADLASELGIDRSVLFFPPEKDIRSKYLDASLYVMSSRFEGFGMVLIEAMACGLPCVSFNCNYGPSDIISHEEDGLLIENGDIAGLAGALIHLISQPDVRAEMGAEAKENVKRFSHEVIVAEWERLFRGLLKKQPE